MRTCLVLASAAVLAASPGTAGARVEHQDFIGSTPVGGISLPVRTMEDMRYANVVRQRYDFSCGSAALATLLSLYGDRQDEAASFRGMWAGGDHVQIRRLGFSLLDMKRFLASRGRTANGYHVSLDQIATAGVPGIALITVRGYRHFVVVEGVRRGEVLIADPALGLRVEPTATFTAAWNGIFFVIDGDLPRGRSAFNTAERWAAYARAPTGARFADPLSLQALSLTSPFYRDF